MGIHLGEGVIEWQQKNLEWMRYDYPDLKPGDIVFDLGSYKREFASKMQKKYKVRVECFDPAENRVAWIYKGALTLNGDENTRSFINTGTKEAPAQTRAFPCYDIAEEIRKFERIALMKINIEGGEYPVMNRILSEGLANRIDKFQIQFHVVDHLDTIGTYQAIADRLSLTHKIDWRYPFCWESWSIK